MENVQKRIKMMEEKLHSLSGEAEQMLLSMQKLSSGDMASELPMLRLRIKKILADYSRCSAEAEELKKAVSPDSREASLLQQLSGMAKVEERWLLETSETLADSEKSLHLSEYMTEKAFAERLRSRFERGKET